MAAGRPAGTRRSRWLVSWSGRHLPAPAPAFQSGGPRLSTSWSPAPRNRSSWKEAAAFDNNITVAGPVVKALAGRYLAQMMEELAALPDPNGRAGSVLESVDLVVPHQANKTMVLQLAQQAGLSPDRLYFNIATVGNASSASIPLAITTRSATASSPIPCASSRPASGRAPSPATP
jgi:3-oxoacyl-[acyl-carrier-protein] synthase III